MCCTCRFWLGSKEPNNSQLCDGKTPIAGSTQQFSPALSPKYSTSWASSCTPSGVHVHPIIHHTPNVKLITAMGHHLGYTAHTGNTLGVLEESESLQDAALQDKFTLCNYALKCRLQQLLGLQHIAITIM